MKDICEIGGYTTSTTCAVVSFLLFPFPQDLDTAEPKTPEDIYKEHLSGDKRDVVEKARCSCRICSPVDSTDIF